MIPATPPTVASPAGAAEMKFSCSICGEASEKICVYCTKDTCSNHLCERCRRCSDCCVCDASGSRSRLDS